MSVPPFRVHVHKHDDHGYGSFLAGAISELDLWLNGWSRRPLYAINVKPKEPTRGDEEQQA